MGEISNRTASGHGLSCTTRHRRPRYEKLIFSCVPSTVFFFSVREKASEQLFRNSAVQEDDIYAKAVYWILIIGITVHSHKDIFHSQRSTLGYL